MSVIERQVLETLRRLPEPQQQEVLDFIARMEQQTVRSKQTTLQHLYGTPKK